MATRDAAAAASQRIVSCLAAERKRQGVSMTVLAAKAEVSQSFISMMESGQNIPSVATLLRIAHALEIDLAPVVRDAQKLMQAGK